MKTSLKENVSKGTMTPCPNKRLTKKGQKKKTTCLTHNCFLKTQDVQRTTYLRIRHTYDMSREQQKKRPHSQKTGLDKERRTCLY